MANKDFFAPPEKEEGSDFFSPPELEQAPTPPISASRAATLGAINQLGLAPAVGGAALAAKDVYGPEYSLKDLVERYRAHRDELKKPFKEAEEQQPLPYVAGNIAAGMALPIPGTSLRNAKSLKEILSKGAAIGGLAGLASSEADLTRPSEETATEALKDVATGATLGAGAGLIGQFLSRTPKKAPEMRTAAEDLALKSLGPSEDIIRKEHGLKGVLGAEEGYRKGIGKTLLEDDLLQPFGGANQIRETIRPYLEKQGTVVKDIRASAAKQISDHNLDFDNFDDSIQAIKDSFAKRLEGVSDGEQRLNKINKVLDSQRQNLNLAKNDITRLSDIKTNIERDLTDRAFSRSMQELPELQAVDLELSKTLKNRIENMANSASPNLGAQLKEANAKMSNYLDIASMATDRAVSEHSKKAAEIGDYVALGFGIPTYIAKKGFEFQTGQSAFDTLKRAQALGLNKTAKIAESPITQGIGSAVGETIEKSGRLPTNLVGLQSKPVSTYTNDYSNINNKLASLKNAQEPEAQELSTILQGLSTKSDKEKDALLYILSENPKYRKYFRD